MPVHNLHKGHQSGVYTVSQKCINLNGIAQNYKDWFLWYLAKTFKSL